MSGLFVFCWSTALLTACLVYLDEVKVDILAVKVSNREHGIDGNVGHLAFVLVDDLGAKSRHGSLNLMHIVVVQNML